VASASRDLTEPRVLAHAKRRLFPEEEQKGYAVVDTQFATERWLGGEPIDRDVRDTLAPFNHVRVGTGYPDLVGVRALTDDLLAVDRLGDEPPLVAIEAKGYSKRGAVDIERGVVQAHDRLNEANATYVAAPAPAITQSARTLATELNVQGVADRSFGLNHPKNYLAYPLAVSHPDDTATVLAEKVVRAVDDARRGAAFLDLIEEAPDRIRLTPLGREVVRFAVGEYGSVDAALDAFDEWKRSCRRFYDLAPRWGRTRAPRSRARTSRR
jgi:hypothetical protein